MSETTVTVVRRSFFDNEEDPSRDLRYVEYVPPVEGWVRATDPALGVLDVDVPPEGRPLKAVGTTVVLCRSFGEHTTWLAFHHFPNLPKKVVDFEVTWVRPQDTELVQHTPQDVLGRPLPPGSDRAMFTFRAYERSMRLFFSSEEIVSQDGRQHRIGHAGTLFEGTEGLDLSTLCNGHSPTRLELSQLSRVPWFHTSLFGEGLALLDRWSYEIRFWLYAMQRAREEISPIVQTYLEQEHDLSSLRKKVLAEKRVFEFFDWLSDEILGMIKQRGGIEGTLLGQAALRAEKDLERRRVENA